MDRDSGELRDVFECPGGSEEAEGVAPTGAAERTVFVIGGGIVPGAETRELGLGDVVVREVVVG